MPPLPAQGNVARHGLLVVAVAAALGLLFSGWSSKRGAEAVADTVNQGQAEGLLGALRESAPLWAGEPSREVLSRFLEEHRAEGLRGIGLIGRDGEIRRFAGTLSDRPLATELGPGPHVRKIGDLIRVYSGPPGGVGRALPPPPGAPPPDGPEEPLARPRRRGMGGPPDDMPPPPMVGRPDGPPRMPVEGRMILELSPLLATSLVNRANRAFAIAAIAAVVLLSAATLLWRRAVREAALARKLAENERLVSLGTMSAVLAHEIKNPLASLKGNAQLVAESLEEGTRPRAQADRVVEAAVRLQTLVTNLLDFSRGGPIARARVDPAELVFLAACEAAPRANLALDAAPALFSLDAVRMGQVLENVLRNAEHASPDRVSAEVKLEGARLVIVVRDEGPGFSGAPEGFFEPFATTKARGTGLGLAVARRIVELHGGTITARNRSEGGAEVRIEIPPVQER